MCVVVVVWFTNFWFDTVFFPFLLCAYETEDKKGGVFSPARWLVGWSVGILVSVSFPFSLFLCRSRKRIEGIIIIICIYVYKYRIIPRARAREKSTVSFSCLKSPPKITRPSPIHWAANSRPRFKTPSYAINARCFRVSFQDKKKNPTSSRLTILVGAAKSILFASSLPTVLILEAPP